MRAYCTLFIAAVCSCASVDASAQTEFKALREIKLPVPVVEHNWPKASYIDTPGYSIHVAPNQDLLISGASEDGELTLERVRTWWTEAPVTEVLNIPGWSSADATKLESLETDIQTTPDGHFAVAFTEATWITPLPPSLENSLMKYTYHKSNRILTVIDLEQWKVIGSIRSSDSGTDSGQDTRVRILNNSLLALRQSDRADYRRDGAKWREHYRLIVIPDLKPGPECAATKFQGTTGAETEKVSESLDKQNDATCADVLTASGEKSVESLESFLKTGYPPIPKSLSKSSLELLYEPQASLWYGIDNGHFELNLYYATGQKLRSHGIPCPVCKNGQLRGPEDFGDYMYCTIEGGTVQHHDLLVACSATKMIIVLIWYRVQRRLYVFDTNNLSERGFARLPGESEGSHHLTAVQSALATVDSQAYVLTVTNGEKLLVYAVPSNP
jgi:hypothetical protein